MRSSTVCTSLEAKKIELQCRKFYAQRPRKDLKLKKIVYPFKLGIHGFARINEAYSSKDELYCSESLWGAEDEIHGTTLDGFAVKALGKERVEKATGTHKATFVDCRGGVYVHVEIGLREQYQNKNESKGQLPSKLTTR